MINQVNSGGQTKCNAKEKAKPELNKKQSSMNENQVS